MDKEIGKTGEYIYLVQERESIRCNDNIYKIGKTKQKPMKRVSAYPTGTKLWITIIVNDATSAEKDLLKIFREKFKQITEIGAEYFYGNPIQMINEIVIYQSEHFSIEDEVKDEVKDEDEFNSSEALSDENENVDKNVNEDVNEDENMNVNMNVDEDVNEDVNENMNINMNVNNSKNTNKNTNKNIPEKHIDDSLIERDVETVMENIKKPMQLSKYTKVLADTVKSLDLSNKHSANIHVKFDSSSNTFDVKSIDINSPNKKMSQKMHFENINVDVDENIFKIALNPYHLAKFNKVKINGITDYIINVCSFEIKQYKYMSYYKTVILPDVEQSRI